MKQLHPKAVAYLAYMHASGKRASHMHLNTTWSTDVLLGSDFDIESCRFVINKELTPVVENHPLVVNVARFKAQGFEHSWRRTKSNKLSEGIAMIHPTTRQEIAIMENGKVKQLAAPGGKWEWKENILEQD